MRGRGRFGIDRVSTGFPDVAVVGDGAQDRAQLLIAVGRSPRTSGLGLDHLGVNLDRDGSPLLDSSLRTSNPRVWAAGDATSHPRFTHVAGVHASLAASNALLGLRRRIDPAVPRVTFTDPEVGAVTDPEVGAVGVATSSPGDGHRTLTWQHTHLDRAVTDGETAGTTRLVVDRRARIVGATVVGPRAGETLGELALAVKRRTTVLSLASTTHAYPTYNDGPWNAAITELRRHAARPSVRRVTHLAVRLRRRWLER